ncbi:methyltransferase domain-containing protein [Candidatus Woesearchaeota archaeon]|nr:methyltransferase domain-containing protein [Candidatus Woesearchaeota archaeon]
MHGKIRFEEVNKMTNTVQKLEKLLKEKSTKKESDIEQSRPDLAPKGIYYKIAMALLPNLHNRLMEMMDRSVQKIEDQKTLVVVGPGKDVLPYSERLETVRAILGDANIVLMDYNDKICREIPKKLEEKGFTNYYSLENVVGEFDPREKKNTVFIQAQNIMDGYTMPDDSVSFIDMTVAVHHATQYEEDIYKFAKEALRVLQPGGYLHIGEGNADMKYSETKLKKIAEDVIKSGEEKVTVTDARYPFAKAREWYFERKVETGEDGEEGVSAVRTDADEYFDSTYVTITDTGMVEIRAKDPERLYSYFADENKGGYKQISKISKSNLPLSLERDTTVVLPFIDASIEADYQGMIVPVRQYYSGKGGIIETTLERMKDPEDREKFMKAILKEQSDAERGLVEFYSTTYMVRDNLEKAGFIVEDSPFTTDGPFANILARKPGSSDGGEEK